MKRAFKILGAVLALLLVALGGFVLYAALDWPVKAPVYTAELKVTVTPERVARGKQLASIRCAGCHYDQKTGGLTGIQMIDAPKEFGPMFSHNITQHPTKGIGRYSDRELVYLMRTGIRRDGVFSGPFMQSPGLGDEDMYSIIAYLRASDDAWLRAQDVDDRHWQPTLFAKILMHTVFQPMAMPKQKIAVPEKSDQVAYGRYVINDLADCYVCHSADFTALDSLAPEKSGGYLGGGTEVFDANGTPLIAANITMDPDTGIGRWSEADFVRAIRSGVRPDGRALRYPMLAQPALTEDELKAAFAYLKTVPVQRHEIARNFVDADKMAGKSEGEKLYYKYACVSCHGADGVGVCDLRNASKKYDTDEKLSAFMHNAASFVPGTTMPTWNGIIAEHEYAPLIAYVHELEKKSP